MNYKQKLKTIGVVFLIISLIISGASITRVLRKKAPQTTAVKSATSDYLEVIDENLDLGHFPVGEPVTSNLRIKNKGDTPAAVRVELSEYLEYSEDVPHKLSKNYYVTYNSDDEVEYAKNSGVDPHAKLGGFVKFFASNGKTAQENYQDSYYYKNENFADYKSVSSEVECDYDDEFLINENGHFLYVLSPSFVGQNLDEKMQIDGQFGKQLVLYDETSVVKVTTLKTGEEVDRWDGEDEAVLDARKTNYYHDVRENDPLKAESESSRLFREYIFLDTNYITQEEYDNEGYEEEKEGKWVYAEDDEGIAWFYWPIPLEGGEVTSPLVNSITISKNISKNFSYHYDANVNGHTYGENVANRKASNGAWKIDPFAPEAKEIPDEFGEDIWLNESDADTGGKEEEAAYRAIAKLGDYKLVVRKKVLPIGNIPYRSVSNYMIYRNLSPKSNAENVRAKIDTWFAGLSPNSEVKVRIVGSTAVKNVGGFNGFIGTNNMEKNTFKAYKYGDGFSNPKLSENAIPFILSTQEALQFCSEKSFNNGLEVDSPYQARANFDALKEAKGGDALDVPSWLRSPNVNDVSHAALLDTLGTSTSGLIVTHAGVRPAMWIKGDDVLNIIGDEPSYLDYVEYAEDLWLNEQGNAPGTPENGVPYRAIAKVGGYKLVVRKRVFGSYYGGLGSSHDDPTYGGLRYNSPDDNYVIYGELSSDYWNPKSLVDCWFDPDKPFPTLGFIAGEWHSMWDPRLSLDSEVRARAVGTDALTNVGCFNLAKEADLPNEYMVDTYGNGFSTPRTDKPEGAFILSSQESAKYLSTSFGMYNENYWKESDVQARANMKSLRFIEDKEVAIINSWLRSKVYFFDAHFLVAFLVDEQSYFNNIYPANGVRPALWITF